MTREEFRIHFRQWRDGRGFTQKVAAQALGVSLRTLQNWEIARNMPTGFGLNALLTAMDASRSSPSPVASKSVLRSRKTEPVSRSRKPVGYSGLSETHLL